MHRRDKTSNHVQDRLARAGAWAKGRYISTVEWPPSSALGPRRLDWGRAEAGGGQFQQSFARLHLSSAMVK